MNIIGLGASTAIGRTVWASAAAARAGASGFSEHAFVVDKVGEPICASRLPWLDWAMTGVDRYTAMLFPVIDEALDGLKHRLAPLRARVGLALALPPPRPGRPADLAPRIEVRIAQRYGNVFSRTVAFEHGHAAGHTALDGAVRSLAASSVDACVIAGVDSYLAAETLEWLEAADQLHGAGSQNNAWGFIPGEAAAAVLVAHPEFAVRAELETLGQIVGVGIAAEQKLIKTDAVCIGEGLTRALRAALDAVDPRERIDNVFCDLNGETYRADEYGFAALRVKDRFRAVSDFVAPADCWGDIGAAGCPLHVALAVISCRKRYSKGSLSMVWASSESGERGATVIRGSRPAAG